MNIGELFIALGFNVDAEPLNNFEKSVASAGKKMLKAAAAATAAAVGFERLVNSTIMGITKLENFNRQTDLFVEKLREWQVVSQLSNVAMSADEVLNSILALQDNLTQIRLGGGNVAPFQLLGVNVLGKDAFTVLEELREAIDGLDSATAVNLLKQTGLSPNFINVLRLSREEFNKLYKEAFLDPEQRKKLLRLGSDIKNIKLQFLLWKDKAIVASIPAIYAFGDAIFKIYNRIADVVRIIGRFIDKTMGLKKWLAGLSIALTGIAIALFPLEALIVGLLLLIEDLQVYMEGGDSLFGRFLEWIKEVGKALQKEIIDRLKDIKVPDWLKLGKLELPSPKELLLKSLPPVPAIALGGAIRDIVVNQNNNISTSAPISEQQANDWLQKGINAAGLQLNAVGGY